MTLGIPRISAYFPPPSPLNMRILRILWFLWFCNKNRPK